MSSFFITISHEAWPKTRLGTHAQLSDVLREWKPTTRVSPLYTYPDLSQLHASIPVPAHTVLLLGMVHPEDVRQRVVDRARICLSLGIYNVLVFDPNESDLESLVDWARSSSRPFEEWDVQDGGLITTARTSDSASTDGVFERGLASVADLALDSELRDAVTEYLPLMASASARARSNMPEVIPDLLEVHESIAARLRKAQGVVSEDARYELLGSLITLNAGLSRFSSQAFSGTGPIQATESHYWTHSLLGTGLANKALWRLTQFILRNLGEARIGHRIESLKRAPAKNLRTLRPTDSFWTSFDIMDVELSEADAREPLVPLLSCFSGRDGFKCTQETISAPLASIAACNSIQWSLLTITHEASHLFIRGVLGTLVPRVEVSADARSRILDRPTNLLEDVQSYVEAALYAMEEAERGPPARADSRTTAELQRTWFGDLEEMLVHAFDYLYFYGFDDQRYVRGIWQSWSVIPNIDSRVPQYVLRTAVALLTQYTSSVDDAEAIALARTEQILRELRTTNSGGQYVTRALQFIDHSRDRLIARIAARRPLAQLVRSMLFSESVANRLRREKLATGGRSERMGYPFVVKDFSKDAIGNPLTFLEAYSSSTEPDAVKSLWILSMLAFSEPEQQAAVKA